MLVAEVAALGEAAHVEDLAAVGQVQARALATDDGRRVPVGLDRPAMQHRRAFVGHRADHPSWLRLCAMRTRCAYCAPLYGALILGVNPPRTRERLHAWPRQRSTEPPFEDSRDYVQSLARGLSVLRAFDARTRAEPGRHRRTHRDVARRRAALVMTLEHLGYVRGSGREYSLSPSVLELGFGYLGSINLTDLAQPLLEDLARAVNQSSSMAVLDGQSIVYVLRVPGAGS
jgi:hypothetical protein